MEPADKFIAGVGVAVVLLVGVATCSSARASDWTPLDYGLQGIASGLIVEDWLISREAARDNYQIYSPAYHREIAVVGDSNGCARIDVQNHGPYPRPSQGRMNLCYGLELVGQAAIAAWLPHKYRWIWESVTIGYEQYYVREQVRIGLKWQF